MKRARPLDDLNGIERPHKAKRSDPRPPELGPITAMLPDLRQVLYRYMDTRTLGRLARTCQGMAKDMVLAELVEHARLRKERADMHLVHMFNAHLVRMHKAKYGVKK